MPVGPRLPPGGGAAERQEGRLAKSQTEEKETCVIGYWNIGRKPSAVYSMRREYLPFACTCFAGYIYGLSADGVCMNTESDNRKANPGMTFLSGLGVGAARPEVEKAWRIITKC
jgi:hypothetical protein